MKTPQKYILACQSCFHIINRATESVDTLCSNSGGVRTSSPAILLHGILLTGDRAHLTHTELSGRQRILLLEFTLSYNLLFQYQLT